jgi:D-alanyl-D-alanine carboxypeptidase/D-alanyl-D-alanine-endopeptidase (penicillin-binding protein 4)
VSRRACAVFTVGLLYLTISSAGADPPQPQRKARLAAPKGHGGPTLAVRREPTAEPRQPANPDDPREQRVAKLRDRLLEVLRDRPLNRTKVGIEVMQASDGDVLFAHNAGVQFNPASNTKMLTTAAAMSFLGSDYRYRTALLGPEPDAEGVVDGDVVLRGSGDPSLSTPDIAEIAYQVAARGVVRVDGDLYADPHFHDAAGADVGAAPGSAPIILNRNTYTVRVRPGDVGHAAQVSIEPRSAFFAVENQATTVRGKRSRLRIDSRRRDDQLIITVRGRISEDRGEYAEARRLGDGALYAAAALRAALEDFGVEVTGDVKLGGPAASYVLGEHRSAPLSDVCRISNKPSNNFVAESIYKTLGGELYGLPGTLAKGTHAVMDYLEALGIRPGTYRIVNGSGLTHENRITPSDLASVLRRIYFDLAVAPEFLSSLAIAGIDGTIRNRFLGTDAVGLVRAKTGTLSGVSALSGYVGDKDDVLVFTIFVQGFRHRRVNEVRRAQVRMVEAMLRFLRSDAPVQTGEPGTEIPGEEPVDSESDGDPQPL